MICSATILRIFPSSKSTSKSTCLFVLLTSREGVYHNCRDTFSKYRMNLLFIGNQEAMFPIIQSGMDARVSLSLPKFVEIYRDSSTFVYYKFQKNNLNNLCVWVRKEKEEHRCKK